MLNPEVGHRFWSEILAQGGARPALESFKAFRGREPTIDALAAAQRHGLKFAAGTSVKRVITIFGSAA